MHILLFIWISFVYTSSALDLVAESFLRIGISKNPKVNDVASYLSKCDFSCFGEFKEFLEDWKEVFLKEKAEINDDSPLIKLAIRDIPSFSMFLKSESSRKLRQNCMGELISIVATKLNRINRAKYYFKKIPIGLNDLEVRNGVQFVPNRHEFLLYLIVVASGTYHYTSIRRDWGSVYRAAATGVEKDILRSIEHTLNGTHDFDAFVSENRTVYGTLMKGYPIFPAILKEYKLLRQFLCDFAIKYLPEMSNSDISRFCIVIELFKDDPFFSLYFKTRDIRKICQEILGNESSFAYNGSIYDIWPFLDMMHPLTQLGAHLRFLDAHHSSNWPFDHGLRGNIVSLLGGFGTEEGSAFKSFRKVVMDWQLLLTRYAFSEDHQMIWKGLDVISHLCDYLVSPQKIIFREDDMADFVVLMTSYYSEPKRQLYNFASIRLRDVRPGIHDKLNEDEMYMKITYRCYSTSLQLQYRNWYRLKDLIEKANKCEEMQEIIENFDNHYMEDIGNHFWEDPTRFSQLSKVERMSYFKFEPHLESPLNLKTNEFCDSLCTFALATYYFENVKTGEISQDEFDILEVLNVFNNDSLTALSGHLMEVRDFLLGYETVSFLGRAFDSTALIDRLDKLKVIIDWNPLVSHVSGGLLLAVSILTVVFYCIERCRKPKL